MAYVAELTLSPSASPCLYSKKHIQRSSSFLGHFCHCSKAIH